MTTQNALLNDVSVVARRHGERFDFATRASAGYSHDMLSDGPGSQSRITMLFAELADHVAGWYARLGRQAGGVRRSAGHLRRHAGGLPAVAATAASTDSSAYPVDSTREGPDSDRKFYRHLRRTSAPSRMPGTCRSTRSTSSTPASPTARRSGTEVRYFRPGITLVGLVDYDIHYNALNNVLLLGTFALPARWTLNINIDQRKSPGLPRATR